MNESEAPIGLAEVRVSLGARPVLQGVSLEIRPGELVSLLGPNGAGKTTVLRAVLGLVRLNSGRVLRDRAQTVGYVPQRHDFAWDFPITVEETVQTGRCRSIGWLRRPSTDDWKAVQRALKRVHMTDLRDRPIGALSGGQRQRVLLARALALDPHFLLLDEPCTGLDVPSQIVLNSVLTELATSGMGLLMTTHDLQTALRMSDRVLLLDGHVVEDAPPSVVCDTDSWERLFGSPGLLEEAEAAC